MWFGRVVSSACTYDASGTTAHCGVLGISSDSGSLTPHVITSTIHPTFAHTTTSHPPHQSSSFHTWHPRTYIPTPSDFYKGAFEAGLPQLPLTTLNSILAVTSLSASLFPSNQPPTPTRLEASPTRLVGCTTTSLAPFSFIKG